MRILVTGGAGFIGSNLVDRLVAAGHSVRVLDDLSSGKRSNLDGVRDQIEFIEGTILSRGDCERAIEGAEALVHLAAMVSVPQSVEDPLFAHENNATGTVRILDAARRAGVKRVVQASTCAVYGLEPTLPKRESMLVQPGSPYASSKMALEAYAQSFSECYGMGITSLRFFNVYGPRQDPTSPYSGVISIFLSRAVGNGKVTVFGDGSQTRDFVFVGDICQAIERALAKECGGADVFNVATGSSVTLNELIETICQVSGRRLEATYADFRAGEIIHSSADISAIQGGLGYQPTVALHDGLRQTFEWYSASLERPSV